MSEKKLTCLSELERVDSKQITQKEAAERVGTSERHVRRLLRQYRDTGASGLVSKKRGKPSDRRTKPTWKEEVITFIGNERIQVFCPTFMAEKLETFRGIKLSAV